MPRETMSPYERWVAVLRRATPDRVPMDYWATPEATQKLLEYLGCDYDEMIRRLHIDLPFTVKGRYVGAPLEPGRDVWGVGRQVVDYGNGVYDEAAIHPLAEYESVEEIEANYRWPNPDDWDYSHLPREVRDHESQPIVANELEPFLLYKELRGDARAFMDLVEFPDIVEYCMDKLLEIEYQDVLRILEAVPGRVLVVDIGEDTGGQNGLMFSPDQIRRFFMPRIRKMIGLVKKHGSYVRHHSDGAIRDILPDLIDAGIEILNPVQWRCQGMEREGLKRDFGDRIIFHGGVDNQQTLPFGSVRDVRSEVMDNYRILGRGGGYILAPCHNIQSVGPAENVVAMYEAGYEFGWLT